MADQTELALQGSLFGLEPEPATIQTKEADSELDHEALERDAQSRPRVRQSAAQEQEEVVTEDRSNSDDLPAWHHHSLVDREQLTPMLRHYVELKAEHPERVLLYRLGDFFECFFEDAIALSRLLELTLTGKEGGKAIGRVPMAGIPHHAAERYCADLVGRGFSVALCDQVEEAAERSKNAGKPALLKREITRVLTPGTVLEEGMLTARRNNWLCAVVSEQQRWGLAIADVSTGEFRVTEREGSDQLHQELLQVEAAEVLWPAPEKGSERPAWCPASLQLTPLSRTPFALNESKATVLARFGLASVDGLGLG